MERKKVLHYRNSKGIAPNPDNIAYGEIAIGYKKDNEAIYIKNSTDEIVGFTPISIVNLTYSQLKELRDNSKLKPAQYYRITDFVTTVANDPEAQSAGHPFDIIVFASEKNKLQEECYAIQHEGDSYFTNCNLAAWKIWYCLDNDNTKYMWADTINGKGVIYRMIDEWQNDCPYDFKNVQFKRYAVADVSSNGILSSLGGTYIGYNGSMKGLNIPDISDFQWMYTFSLYNENNELVDYSSNCLHGPFTDNIGYASFIKRGGCTYNTISNTYRSINIDGQYYISLALNNIVLITEMRFVEGEDGDVELQGEMTRNIFELANSKITLKNNPSANKFGVQCYNNIVGGSNNTFGNGCNSNTFGNDCNSNTFGDNCRGNTFVSSCYNNAFRNNCTNNTFGDNCQFNTFGNFCLNNTFGNGCSSNTFGNGCNSNTFGNYCEYNAFRNDCINNTFGNECYRNTFGNGCSSNTFGNGCNSNTFGDGCNSNTFGNNFQENTLGNYVAFVTITTDNIYHTHILNGTKGDRNNKLTINFTPETTYSQFAGLTPDNVLEVWVETTTPHNVIDGGSY